MNEVHDGLVYLCPRYVLVNHDGKILFDERELRQSFIAVVATLEGDELFDVEFGDGDTWDAQSRFFRRFRRQQSQRTEFVAHVIDDLEPSIVIRPRHFVSRLLEFPFLNASEERQLSENSFHSTEEQERFHSCEGDREAALLNRELFLFNGGTHGAFREDLCELEESKHLIIARVQDGRFQHVRDKRSAQVAAVG